MGGIRSSLLPGHRHEQCHQCRRLERLAKYGPANGARDVSGVRQYGSGSEWYEGELRDEIEQCSFYLDHPGFIVFELGGYFIFVVDQRRSVDIQSNILVVSMWDLMYILYRSLFHNRGIFQAFLRNHRTKIQ